MEVGVQPARHIQFGAFDLDLETGELRRRGRAVKLSPQPLQVLALLAGSPGRLVVAIKSSVEPYRRNTFIPRRLAAVTISGGNRRPLFGGASPGRKPRSAPIVLLWPISRTV